MSLKRYFLLLLCLCAIMVLKTQSGHAAVLELVIKSFKGAPLIRIPVRQGDIFSLYYIHSVDISPVYEVFAVDAKKGIVLMQSCMKMFGAGFDPWQAHGKIVEEKGWLKMKGLHVPLGSFLLRIGAPTVDHTLKIKGMTLYLSRMMPEKRVWFGISGVNKTENGGSE